MLSSVLRKMPHVQFASCLQVWNHHNNAFCHQGLRGSSAAKHLNKHLKLSLCIALLREVKKYECTLKCTEFLYKHSEDLHSKGTWGNFCTKSCFSLEMAFQLIAKFHIIQHSTRRKTIISSKPSFQLESIFFNSHKTWKIKQIAAELFFSPRKKKKKDDH